MEASGLKIEKNPTQHVSREPFQKKNLPHVVNTEYRISRLSICTSGNEG